MLTATGHAWGDWQVTKAATCTVAGTQTRTCANCDAQETQTIRATGHQHTAVRNAVHANCETEGYTGDIYCTDCGALIKTGKTIAALDHRWDSGVVSKEATEDENGIRLYTCTICGQTRTEEIPYVKQRKAPSVSLTVEPNSAGKLVLTGKVNDYENLDNYYEITSHGLVYMHTVRLGMCVLTVNSSGRTKVNFGAYRNDGSYVYTMTPTNKNVSYTVRAFVSYVDPTTGRTTYVYSDAVVGSYNKLLK